MSFVIGLVTGLAISALDWAVSYVTHALLFATATPAGTLLLPAMGLGLAGVCLSLVADKKPIHGTEEFIHAYHQQGGRLRLLSLPLKTLASIFTIAFGGSAGLEGPSIYLGAGIGNFLTRVQKKFNLHEADARTMLLAGAAAGISAIFRAPLTGIVFGLEVPYKDDLGKEALIPALIASTTAYVAFVTLHGTEPLFSVARVTAQANFSEIMFSALLGLIVGLAARIFVLYFRKTEDYFHKARIGLVPKMIIGGLLTGLAGLVSLSLLGSPLPLGTGYEIIPKIVSSSLTLEMLVGLLFLKGFATTMTLASGGVGGVFIPMVVMGGILGAIIGKLLPFGQGYLYPIVGMSSFLSAGYKTPLAAVTFIAETTGSPHFIIPGLVAAAVSYTVSGTRSISSNQRWSRMTKIEELLSTRVGDIMSKNVITAPAEVTVTEFFQEYLLTYRHKSLPLVEGDRLFGMIGLSDLTAVPESDWHITPVGEIATKEVLVAFPDQPLANALDIMNGHDIDRMPVVSEEDPKKIIGVVSVSDITASEELAKYWNPGKKRG